MTRTNRLPIPLLAVLLLAPGVLSAAGPCTDCCLLPCVEAEIRYAQKMQAFYRQQAGARGLTQQAYEDAERAAAEAAAAERGKDVGSLRSCAFNLPDPKTDPVAVRQWNAAGWGIRTDDGKKGVTYVFSLKTDTKTCALSEKQVKLLHEITPCTGMADAAEAHERFHVESCLARKGKAPSVADVARDEVAAYDVELRQLDALRETVRKACQKKSCRDKDATEASARLGKEIDELKKQLARRGGK